jgi:hypothetical protein
MATPLYPFPATWDTSRYTRSFLMADQKEEEVQAAIVEQLATLGLELDHTDAGGKRARGQIQRLLRRGGHGEIASQAAAIKGATCLPSGFADLHGTLAPLGRAVYIEVKRPGLFDQAGRCLRKPELPRQDQLDFLSKKHRAGAIVGVAWSASDAIAILRPYLGAHCGHLRSLQTAPAQTIASNF